MAAGDGAGRPTLSITISGLSRIFGSDLSAVVEWCMAAERAGVHQVVLPDHVVMGDDVEDYPFGTFPYPPTEPWLEPMVTLGAVAGATSTIRLGTGVLVAPARPAPLLAKQAATLAVLSQGRFDLGVAEGWQAAGVVACGVPVDGGARPVWQVLDEQIAACVALWSSSPATVTLDGVVRGPLWCEPRPPGGSVPLWFGGGPNARTARRVAAWGVGWLPYAGLPLDDLRRGIDRLRDAYVSAGRDPATLEVRAGLRGAVGADGAMDPSATAAAADALVVDGITSVSVTLGRQVTDPAQAIEFVDALGAAWQA